MAAYAALVSLMHIIQQIHHHPRPPISLDNQHLQSLTQNITFLQNFLEFFSHIDSKEAEALETCIADTSYCAEDVIESHIVDKIQAGSTGEEISSVEFSQSLQNVMQEMDSIKKVAMEIKEKTVVQDHRHKNLISISSMRSSSSRKNIMVGFDDMLLEIMDKLTGQRSSRQIIPIVGMGGIGKTTLARNIYINRLIKHHFDICGWATISQQYDAREILTELLRQGEGEGGGDLSEDELGVKLHKYLSGRRYLIVLDDMWSSEAWDAINNFFPDSNNGSRIVVTTRLSSLASQLTRSYVCVMRFLNENEIWNLFCQTVFGEGVCPLELEETGKSIARSCKGLPLSAVVIGGFLKKSEHIREYWEYIARNLNTIVASEDSGRCMKIIQMSYDQLPVYLKPCFLYMGVFPEDRDIRVPELIKLWVAEGFLKPVSGKDMEEVAVGYFKDLVDRNLILGTSGSTGKCCNIHDLLRDFCLREAKKEKFLYVAGEHSLDDPHDINTQRRIAHHQRVVEEKVSDALLSTSVARSLLCDPRCTLWSRRFRLLRIWKAFDDELSYEDGYSLEDVFRHLNSRYIQLTTGRYSKFPSSIHLLWNLQTLTVVNNGLEDKTAPPEIWKMPQLRHVEFHDMLCLPDPPSDQIVEQDDYVFGNLRTLSKIQNFKCSEEVIKRIPNIRKLRIIYDEELEESSPYSLNNLERLNKLESFLCDVSELLKPSANVILQDLTFPHSLKKLSLIAGSEDILEKIGSLPLLEKLQLISVSFDEDEWETAEGQFCSLKFLLIQKCDLKHWYTDGSHFPCLKHLVLNYLHELEEIPSCIGDIPTLESIELNLCSDSTLNSAIRILEEQEELGNDGLLINGTHLVRDLNEEPDSVASPNFQVEIW